MSLGFGFMFPRLVGLAFVAEGIKEEIRTPFNRQYGFIRLREIGEQMGLHFSTVGDAVQRVADNPTRTMAQSLKILERKFKNQES